MKKVSKRSLNKEKLKYILLIFLFLLIYSLPYIVCGHNVHLNIHDNLNQINMLGIFDGRFSARFLPSENIPEYTLPTTPALFHLAHLKLDKLFYLIDFFHGYIFNELTFRLIALAGIFLLFYRYLLKGFSKVIILLISFCFVSLPFWSQGNLSIAGIPLVIYAVIEIWFRKQLVLSYLILIIYGLYSNYFLTGVYVHLLLVMMILISFFRKKNPAHFIISTVIFFIIAIISHLPVFLNLFIYRIPTNRIAQDLVSQDFFPRVKAAIFLLINSTILSHSYHKIVILPFTAILTSYLIIFKKGKKTTLIILFWNVLIFNCIVYGLFFYGPFYSIYQKFNLGYNFSRIYVINTPLWYILWALCLYEFKNVIPNKKLATSLIIILISAQLLINFGSYYRDKFGEKPGFSDFVSCEQFEIIKEELDAGSNMDIRVGCIGFFPAVANFNGLMTVDSFSAYYPLEYKNRFTKIIQIELEKNEELRDYFNRRGSALFLFDDLIGKNYYDQNYINKNFVEITCELDIAGLQELGCSHILSTVKISNFSEIKMVESKKIKGDYYKKIYIYKIS